MTKQNHTQNLAIPSSDADRYLDAAQKRLLDDILTSIRTKRATETANAIVEQLFQNSKGQAATRLVLALPNGQDGGAWGRGAVRQMILKQLERGT